MVGKINGEPNQIGGKPQPPAKGIAQYHGGLGADGDHKGGDVNLIPSEVYSQQRKGDVAAFFDEAVLL